ncbi:MAG: hypothetical protein K0R62_4232 [Nonomuraea muscovyensis]|nr:hypothetical protein [Nonomuraea muscovyensis]
MRSPWPYAAGVLALLAAAWVVAPLASDGPEMIAGPPLTAGPGPRELTGPAPSPIRYAYEPTCRDDSPGCEHWILVSARGERWWLPHGLRGDVFVLSWGGTRAVHWHDKQARYVVRDLTTGITRPLPYGPGKDALDPAGYPRLLSPDGRHLLLQPGRGKRHGELSSSEPGGGSIVDVERGTTRRLPRGERGVAWTPTGLVLVTEKPESDSPGHITSAAYVIRSATGGAVRRFTLPGNLAHRGLPSPAADVIASPAAEVAPDGVDHLGVVLTDTRTGRTVRTVVPRLPAGWWIDRILSWADDGALAVTVRGSHHERALRLLDLADGTVRPVA